MIDVYPCFCFEGNAQEALQFYVDAIPNSQILESQNLFPSASLNGCKLIGMDVEEEQMPDINFLISIKVKTQEQVNELYEILVEGGKEWVAPESDEFLEYHAYLSDRFGVDWALAQDANINECISVGLQQIFYNYESTDEVSDINAFHSAIFSGIETKEAQNKAVVDSEKDQKTTHIPFESGNNWMGFSATNSFENKYVVGRLSYYIECDTQSEIDYFWEKLIIGGEEESLGCIKDKYGARWQIVPRNIERFMVDPLKISKVVMAMKGMRKFNIQALLEA
jgi:predicted 3-demethylubiquinone-9 3-methyltransferase (glyoxalase superfamily)